MTFIQVSLYAGDGTTNPALVDPAKIAWIQLFQDPTTNTPVYSLHLDDGSEISVIGSGPIAYLITGTSQENANAIFRLVERAPKITRPETAKE